MVTEEPAEVFHDRRTEREALERRLAAVRGGSPVPSVASVAVVNGAGR